MIAQRSRRVARIAMLSIAGTLLLVSGYVSSYFGMWWLTDRGIVTGTTSQQLQATVYRPISHYMGSSGAGSATARRSVTWVHSLASGKPAAWDSIDGEVVIGGHPILPPRATGSPDQTSDR